jgi:hypothetical protein
MKRVSIILLLATFASFLVIDRFRKTASYRDRALPRVGSSAVLLMMDEGYVEEEAVPINRRENERRRGERRGSGREFAA